MGGKQDFLYIAPRNDNQDVTAVPINPLSTLLNRQPLIVKMNTPNAHTAVLIKYAVNADGFVHYLLFRNL
jgi:hypothetical protein